MRPPSLQMSMYYMYYIIQYKVPIKLSYLYCNKMSDSCHHNIKTKYITWVFYNDIINQQLIFHHENPKQNILYHKMLNSFL